MICKICKGIKKVMGMGMMKEGCPECKGTGFEKTEALTKVNSVSTKKTVRKKYETNIKVEE